MASTVMDVFRNTMNKHTGKSAICYKENGQWKAKTWLQYWNEVHQLAAALIELGLAAGDYTAILSNNCPEWAVADLATIACGAAPCGIYATSSTEQCAFIINHCQAKVVFVENEIQLKKILQIKDQCPNLRHIVVMRESLTSNTESFVYSWQKMMLLGAPLPLDEVKARYNKAKTEDIATLVYTSGTTANPKAVMLTHSNLVWMADTVVFGDLNLQAKDVLISYLPLSHIAEQMICLHGPILAGTCVYFAENFERLGDNLREVRPTIFFGVPRVWEKIQEKMVAKASENSAFKKVVAKWSKAQGLRLLHRPEQKAKDLRFRLAEKLVYSKVKAALGLDRCRIAVTAAAPISLNTLEFFWSLNIPIYELYGMSECTGPATLSLPGSAKVGFVGKTLSGTELQIASDGEIIVRGAHVFKGYLHDENATKDAVDSEGWLHTGDIGEFDANGYLRITGRKKNIIITSGGENIAPEMLENKCKSIIGVAHAVVVGDQQKYLSLLIALDPNEVQIVGKKVGSKAQNLEELAACSKYQQYVQEEINQINKGLARVQTIKAFSILPNDFSEETGELTPTMKVKRNFVLKKYETTIIKLY